MVVGKVGMMAGWLASSKADSSAVLLVEQMVGLKVCSKAGLLAVCWDE